MAYDTRNLFTDIQLISTAIKQEYEDSNLLNKIKVRIQTEIIRHKLIKSIKNINILTYDLLYSFAYFLEDKNTDKCMVNITYHDNRHDSIKIDVIEDGMVVSIELLDIAQKKFKLSLVTNENEFTYLNDHYDVVKFYNKFDSIANDLVVKNIIEVTISYLNTILT